MSNTPQHAADRPVAAGARADHDARRSFVRRIRRVAVALTLVLAGTFLWGLLRAVSRGVRSVAVGDHHPLLMRSEFSIHVERPAALFVATRTAASGSRAKAGRVEVVPERDIRELKGFVKGIKTEFVREGDRL